MVEPHGPGRSQIDDLGAAVSVLFQLHTLLAVVGIGHTGLARDDAPAFKAPVVAFLAYARQDGGVHERIAGVPDALAVVPGSDPGDGYPRQLSADDQVGICGGRARAGGRGKSEAPRACLWRRRRQGSEAIAAAGRWRVGGRWEEERDVHVVLSRCVCCSGALCV